MARPLRRDPAPAPGSGVAGEVLLDEPGLQLTRFAPSDPSGAAVLLVPPLAVPARVYDLRPGHSLVQHLLDAGHPVHLADYGEIGFAERRLGLEHWVNGVLPQAIATAAERDGAVHVLGWSLGGTLSILALAAHPSLSVRSLTTLATPIDYRRMPMYRPLVAAARVTGGRVTETIARTLGGAPAPVVQGGYRVLGARRELRKPLRSLRHRGDEDRLSHERSVDGFLNAMPGYPGRLFLQLWHRLILGGQLADGVVELAGNQVRLAELATPVLAVGSRADEVASWDAVAAIADVLTGAPSLRLEEVGGNHLGIVTGRLAVATTWPLITSFLADVEAGH